MGLNTDNIDVENDILINGVSITTSLNDKLETVNTDATLTGDGTSGSPLSVVGGGGGAVNSVNGQIVDNTDAANPIVNENTYIEESTIIAGSATGLWVVRVMGAAYGNHDLELKVYKSADNLIAQFGVREAGSTVPKYFPIRRQCTHMEVRTDALGRFEIQANNNNIIFEITGKKPIL